MNNQLSHRCTPSGYLPTILINMLAIIPVGSVVSCTDISGVRDDIVTVAEPEKQIDSLSGYVFVRCTEPLERVDLFVYPDKEPRELMSHIVMKGKPFVAELQVGADTGDLIVLAAGNLADDPDTNAIARYETAESYKVRYADCHAYKGSRTAFYKEHGYSEGKSLLPQSGTGMCSPGTDLIINMTPLCAEVRIRSISNLTGGYNMIERPEFHLEKISDGTELFRMTGFFPAETLASSDTLSTDCDVGMFTQYPDLALFCLPDESGSTSLVMDCTVCGEKSRFEKKLGALARGSMVIADIEIISPSDWSCTMTSTLHL